MSPHHFLEVMFSSKNSEKQIEITHQFLNKNILDSITSLSGRHTNPFKRYKQAQKNDLEKIEKITLKNLIEYFALNSFSLYTEDKGSYFYVLENLIKIAKKRNLEFDEIESDFLLFEALKSSWNFKVYMDYLGMRGISFEKFFEENEEILVELSLVDLAQLCWYSPLLTRTGMRDLVLEKFKQGDEIENLLRLGLLEDLENLNRLLEVLIWMNLDTETELANLGQIVEKIEDTKIRSKVLEDRIDLKIEFAKAELLMAKLTYPQALDKKLKEYQDCVLRAESAASQISTRTYATIALSFPESTSPNSIEAFLLLFDVMVMPKLKETRGRNALLLYMKVLESVFSNPKLSLNKPKILSYLHNMLTIFKSDNFSTQNLDQNFNKIKQMVKNK
jgi:hypothetical protein